jgi:hypothetical protein
MLLGFWGIVFLVIFLISLLVFSIPGSFFASPLDALCDQLGQRCKSLNRSLVVQETTLVSRWPTSSEMEHFGEIEAWQNFGEPLNLRDRDLCGGSFEDSVLVRADLRGANLQGASLSRTNLKSAKLQGADLRYANLQEANLAGANLTEADLTGANLLRTVLSGANCQDVVGANLEGRCPSTFEPRRRLGQRAKTAFPW